MVQENKKKKLKHTGSPLTQLSRKKIIYNRKKGFFPCFCFLLKQFSTLLTIYGLNLLNLTVKLIQHQESRG